MADRFSTMYIYGVIYAAKIYSVVKQNFPLKIFKAFFEATHSFFDLAAWKFVYISTKPSSIFDQSFISINYLVRLQ